MLPNLALFALSTFFFLFCLKHRTIKAFQSCQTMADLKHFSITQNVMNSSGFKQNKIYFVLFSVYNTVHKILTFLYFPLFSLFINCNNIFLIAKFCLYYLLQMYQLARNTLEKQQQLLLINVSCHSLNTYKRKML